MPRKPFARGAVTAADIAVAGASPNCDKPATRPVVTDRVLAIHSCARRYLHGKAIARLMLVSARSREIGAAAEMLLTTAEQVSDDGGSPADYALRAHDHVGEREQNYQASVPSEDRTQHSAPRLGPKFVSARETGGFTLIRHFAFAVTGSDDESPAGT